MIGANITEMCFQFDIQKQTDWFWIQLIPKGLWKSEQIKDVI